MKMFTLKTAFFKTTHYSENENYTFDANESYFKFCATNKLLNLKRIDLKNLSQICDFPAFKHVLDLTSKCAGADWTEQNIFF